jgi:hypothetical protein
LPAVEPGFPARRTKPFTNSNTGNIRNPFSMPVFFPGGKDAALYIRQDA